MRRCGSLPVVHCILLAVCANLLLMAQVIQAAPYFMLTNTRAKCVAVLAPQGQTVTIQYHAPDVQLSDEDEELEAIEARKMAEADKVAADGADGMDSEWNKRLQEKLERMKAKKMRDMSVTVSQSSTYGAAGSTGSRSRRNQDYVSGKGRIREELTKREGTIKFMTNDMDGKVDICVQSIIASAKAPSRISLNVSMEATEGADSQDEDSSAADASGEGWKADDIKTQMGRFERDLATLKSRVKHIISNADFNKEQADDFHENSVAMNRAATYWPIVQLVVFVVAGFTQANHIVTYMKTRHIV
mmetsp:Transcript_25023/g.38294  ORF Transcript_25023/g.38294 Transcript_25023/m.38294 type:complete len:302 (+) Transcript_25023:286-1191(+)